MPPDTETGFTADWPSEKIALKSSRPARLRDYELKSIAENFLAMAKILEGRADGR